MSLKDLQSARPMWLLSHCPEKVGPVKAVDERVGVNRRWGLLSSSAFRRLAVP